MYTPFKLGAKLSPPDSRDIFYQAKPTSLQSVDLRQYANGIEFQDNIGSCTANSIVSACEIILTKHSAFTNLSRLFLYYNARDLINSVGQEGAYIRDALKVSKKFGICPEVYWPYDIDKVDVKPNDEAYSQALNYKVARYESIVGWSDESRLLRIKSALEENLPVIIGMEITSELMMISGPIETQQYKGTGYSESLGYHAMVIVGFDDQKQYCIVENSWGTNWGDNGYFSLPYSGFRDVFELWVITQFNLRGEILNAEMNTIS